MRVNTLGLLLFTLGIRQWDTPALRELLEQLLPQHTSVRDYEITADFPKRGKRTLCLNATRVAWPEHAFILMTINDITDRRYALRLLQEGDQQKNEFLAMLAHELRNPLAAMSNAVHIWKHPDAGIDLKREAQAMLVRQLENQTRLVDDLLDVSRITRGLVNLKLQRFNLVGAVRQACEGVSAQIAANRHELSLALPEGDLMIEGDPMRIEQVVTNLLMNAIKYTPPGGHIDLTLQRDGNDAMLALSDTGIGMTPEFMEQAFQVFVQADNAAGKTQGGLGMGLALVRRLVELHGGIVQAQSKGLNQGSRFVVRVPALPADDAPRAISDEAAGLPPILADTATTSISPARRRVLIVDDNEDAAYSTAALLELNGYEVKIASDGPSALQEARRFKPQSVLLDIGLPGMDGYEVSRRLRGMPDQQDTVIVALSGFGHPQSMQQAGEAGIDHQLTKPADMERLGQYLRSPRMSQQQPANGGGQASAT